MAKQRKQNTVINATQDDIDNLLYEQIRYLNSILEDEKDRQKIIEGKLAQIIAQSSTIFSITTLFLALLYDKLVPLTLIGKCTLVCIFIVSLVGFLTSIFYALKNLKIKEYKYMMRSPQTVKDSQLNTKKKFLEEEFKDLQKCVENNQNVNHNKGGDLIKAQHWFKVGLVFTSCLLLLIILFSFWIKKETKSASNSEESLRKELKIINERLLLLEKVSKLNALSLKEPNVLSDSNRLLKTYIDTNTINCINNETTKTKTVCLPTHR